MNLPIALVCKANKVRKNGTAVVSIQYCFNSEERTELGTGIAIPPKFWSCKRKCISNTLPEVYGAFEELNGKLEDELKKAQEIVCLGLKRKENPLNFLKIHYNPNCSYESVMNFLARADADAFSNNVYLTRTFIFRLTIT